MKVKYILIASILLVGMAACELMGDLNKMVPPHKMTDDNVITDAKSAESLLNGVYTSWRTESIGSARLYLNGLSGTGDAKGMSESGDFGRNAVQPDNFMLNNHYPALYNVVNNATTFLYNMAQKEQVKGLSDERRAEMYAEARYLRAQAYLMVLRVFGEFFDASSQYGIVLYGEKPVRDNTPIERSSVADSYKAILADLDYAIKYAPANQPKHYRVGLLTAKALKARVLLYMKEFRKAADLAGEVIAQAEEKGYGLEENFVEMFQNGYESKEMLFALYSSSPTEIYEQETWNGVLLGGTISKIAVSLIKGKRDKRFKQIFVDKIPGKEQLVNNKYCALASEVKQDSHYYIRLAEMYYIIAEAETRLGRIAEARKALTDIICLPRAGYTEDYVAKIPEKEMLKTILEHKWMEFGSENNEEWIDLVRYRVWDNFAIKPYYVTSDAHMLLPIPKRALAANKLLKQNVGY